MSNIINIMFPLFFFLILPFIFLSFHIKFGACGLHDEVASLFNPMPKNVEQYAKNRIHYLPEGNLFIPGEREGYSEIITLFFKKEKTACTPFFQIRFCLPIDEDDKCVNGITICYESQMKGEFNKKYYNDMNLHLRDDLNCSNKKHFGFKVYTDGEDGKAAKNFKIKATIDEHIYVFPIPEPDEHEKDLRCFVLNMGSENSLATTVTNTKFKKLIFVGDPPVHFDNNTPSLQYDEKNTMNLWMLFLDFMKFFPSQFKYNELSLQFTGGGNECALTANFDTSSINVCKKDQELIGSCGTENLDSSDLECSFELRASQSVEEGNEDSFSHTDSKSKSNTISDRTQEGYSLSLALTYGVELGIKVTGKVGIPLVAEGGIEADVRAKFEAQFTAGYNKKWETTKSETTTTEDSDTTTFTKTLREVDERGKTVNVKIHRTDGGSVNFYQSVFMCSGQTFRYHHVTAEGDADHDKPYQSTVVYEKRKDDGNQTKSVNGTETDGTSTSKPDDNLEMNIFG